MFVEAKMLTKALINITESLVTKSYEEL